MHLFSLIIIVFRIVYEIKTKYKQNLKHQILLVIKKNNSNYSAGYNRHHYKYIWCFLEYMYVICIELCKIFNNIFSYLKLHVVNYCSIKKMKSFIINQAFTSYCSRVCKSLGINQPKKNQSKHIYISTSFVNLVLKINET